MIKVSDKYYIDSDPHCFTLVELVERTSKEGEKYIAKEPYGYYGTLDGCFRGIMKKEVRQFVSEEDIKTIKQLEQFILDLEKELREKLSFLNKEI